MTDVQSYRQLTQREHILARTSMYLGSTSLNSEQVYVYNADKTQIEMRECSFVQALLKIVDELLVNACDCRVRDPYTDTIKVTIDTEFKFFSVYNNGRKIVPLDTHPEYKCPVPELIFGRFLTSSNFDDSEERITGGMNGVGSKGAIAMSKETVLKIVDSERGVTYTQKWTENMSVCHSPVIKQMTAKEKKSGQDSITLTIWPDFARFGNATSFQDSDILKVIERRVVDLAGILDFTTDGQDMAADAASDTGVIAVAAVAKKVKQEAQEAQAPRDNPAPLSSRKPVRVFFNNERVPARNFKEYVKLYLEEGQKFVYRQFSNRWQVAVTSSPDGSFRQVSFVNAINTADGGTHVSYITEQLVSQMTSVVRKKHESVKPSMIRNNLWVFVNCLIVNPSFDNQIKTRLKTPEKAFGSSCKIPEDFITQVLNRTSVVELALEKLVHKAEQDLSKTDGRKCQNLIGIKGLEDAEYAGTSRSKEAVLILCEGESAAAMVRAGLTVVNRAKYGIYALRGKLLNVRGMDKTKAMENTEISSLVKILGLQHGKKYADTKDLRYGELMEFTDMDKDGSHIRAEIFNTIQAWWPELIRLPKFISLFITPIVRVKTGSGKNMKKIWFFSEQEARDWIENAKQSGISFTYKYFKGLGTSTSDDAKEYFQNLDKHKFYMKWGSEDCDTAIDQAFSSKTIHIRKTWVSQFVPNDPNNQIRSYKDLTYADFVHKELILFHVASCARAIPSVIDGLKPGQRKILYVCLIKNLTQEIKVAQLAGAVAENTQYHHGENSLCETIVKMAQTFPGSNNINLLVPSGQFGTRNSGGKDSAAARYIFTNLSEITRNLFPALDDPVLDYLQEDGMSVEPQYYVPIIPMVLVNGARGVGTGYATHVQSYDPRDVVRLVRQMIDSPDSADMVNTVHDLTPWYCDFQGEIVPISPGHYACYGRIEKMETKSNNNVALSITELPVGTWTTDYKQHLEQMVETKKIQHFIEVHTDIHVHFKVKLTQEQWQNANSNDLYKYFKLVETLHTTNMILYDSRSCLKHYKNVVEIIRDFFPVRLELYAKRKRYLLAKISEEVDVLENRVRYIGMVRSGHFNLTCTHEQLLDQLIQLKFKRHPKKTQDSDSPDHSKLCDFYYLVHQTQLSLTQENMERLDKECERKKSERDQLEQLTELDAWRLDLDRFSQAFGRERSAPPSSVNYIPPGPYQATVVAHTKRKSLM